MRLEINKFNKDYYLHIGDAIDNTIANVLDMPLEEYKNILLNNGAHVIFYLENKYAIGYEFKRKRDAKATVKALEPYLILAKLTK